MNYHMNEKRQFIQWLLENYRHENPGVDFLLDYISQDPSLLKYVEFTDQASYAPRALYVSYLLDAHQPFVYYKDHKSFVLSDQAFHDIRLNSQGQKEVFFIEIDIPNIYEALMSFGILADNPYRPQDQGYEAGLDDMLNQWSLTGQTHFLKKSMDTALDEKDYALAEALLNRLENIRGGLHEGPLE